MSSRIRAAAGWVGRTVRTSLSRLSTILIVASVGVGGWIGIMMAVAFAMVIVYPFFLIVVLVAIATGSLAPLNGLIQDAVQKVKDA